MADWTDVASTDELAPGDYRVVDIDDAFIAVFNIEGEFYAIEDVCTHDYETLTGGCIDAGNQSGLAFVKVDSSRRKKQ